MTEFEFHSMGQVDRAWSSLIDAEKSIRASELCGLPFELLVRRLISIHEDESASGVINALVAGKWSHKEETTLAQALSELSARGDTLPRPQKTLVDKLMGQLVARLPFRVSREALSRSVLHSRKSRREFTKRALRQAGVDDVRARALLELYRENEDFELLELIARSPTAVQAVDEVYLLSELDEIYWRMRVFEALLQTAPTRTHDLAHTYPREFVWAVGRLRDSTEEGLVMDVLQENQNDLEVISLSAWTFGRLQVKDKLLIVRRILEAHPQSTDSFASIIRRPGDPEY